MQSERFRDRTDAGRQLAGALRHLRRDSRLRVLALPRGGVPVASEVAASLDAPLDVFGVRKLGVPGREELAMGAVATGGVVVDEPDVLASQGVPRATFERAAADTLATLGARERAWRGDAPPLPLEGAVAMLVDDGLATGATMRAAVRAARERGAWRVVVAVPVAPRETCALLADEADEVVCLYTPDPFVAVGYWYEDFGQTSDADVRERLETARRRDEGSGAAISDGAHVARGHEEET